MNRVRVSALLVLCLALSSRLWGQGIVVDHTSLSQFDQIPEAYLQAARNLRMLFMNRSVGVNTDSALDCFTAAAYGSSQVTCRRNFQLINGSWQLTLLNNSDLAAGNVPAYIRFVPSATRYDRSNWDFYIFADTWEKMTTNFIQGLHNGAIPAQTADTNQAVNLNPLNFNVISFQFSYLNVEAGSTISDFFNQRSGQFNDVYDLEQEISDHLSNANPPRLFVYWTTSLARSIGTDASQQFNDRMRQWCRTNNKILFDFADIEAYDMNGNPCFDNRDGVPYTTPSGSGGENYPDDGRQIPAVCQEKTTETDGGHLGTAQGLISVAKGLWILMARVAGWSGGTAAGPVISSVVPNSGPTTGNTSVRVTGQNFEPGITVRFGGVLLSQLTFVSSTEVQGVTGPHAAGAVDVEITQPSGTALLTGGYTYTSPPPVTPVISSVTPNSGSTAGGTSVRIIGQNFTPGIVVRVGGVSLTQLVFVSSTEVQGVTGPHAGGVVDVEATQSGLTGRLAGAYTYTAAPVNPSVSAIYPASGPTMGNTMVRVLGQNFAPGMVVRLGGSALSQQLIVSSTEVQGITSPHGVGAVDVEAASAGGAGVLTGGYSYQSWAAVAPQPNSLRIPLAIDTPEFRTNLGVNNVSSQPGLIRISLVDNNGLLAGQGQINVPAMGMTQVNNVVRFLEGASSLTGRLGYLLLESSQSIKAWASQVDNVSSDPSMQIARSVSAQRLLLPSSVSSERFGTSLTVVNTSPSSGTVKIVSRSATGVVQASLENVSIAAYGQLFFPDVFRSLGLSGVFGPLEIEGLGGISLLASGRIFSVENTSGHFESMSNQPLRRAVIPFAIDTTEFRTNVGIDSLSDVIANVQVSLRDLSGLMIANLNSTVPPRGMTQLSNVIQTLLGSSTPTNREGTLWLDSDQDITAWASQIDNATQDPSFMISRPGYTGTLLIPSVTRLGDFRSALVVTNLGDASAWVELRFRDLQGNVLASRVHLIPAGGFFSSVNILADLGISETFGPLEIVSLNSQPLAAVSRVFSTSRTGGYFEAVPVQ